MTEWATTPTGTQQWQVVDEGWGRRAVEFATLSEPTNCREYVTVHHRLGVGAGDRLLDIACGAGLALELASLRGARCAGIDASPRLLTIAADRSPDAELRAGDMNELPWDDATFDVVTSFRGIWGTTPRAVAEAFRVLVPGGRIGLTVWGHIKASPGAWALAPFALAAEPKVQNQAAMVALGRPGAGEALLSEVGFGEIERVDVPFVFEFSDPDAYARALASTGPAFEAIQAVGEESFLKSAARSAQQQLREGLPLRAPISVVGYLAVKPKKSASRIGQSSVTETPARHGFLATPAPTTEGQQLLDDDLESVGYVMNVSRLWTYLPGVLGGLSQLLGETTDAGFLTFRQRAVLVTATAAALGDSYCSMAWGKKLAEATTVEIAVDVINGETQNLNEEEIALADWARKVVRDPSAITDDDLNLLRLVGFDDAKIFAITAFVSLRLAFATVNDALGAVPDSELFDALPENVRAAVTFGRRPDSGQVDE